MNVLLGVTGGIAAYKAADLTSQLLKIGASVRVVMTPGATQFVGPLTFEALCGHPVMVDTFATGGSPDGASAVEHIAWAKWADVAVIAPATAASLGKLAHGIADNALLTVWLALPQAVPQLICPAMNTVMWEHPAVQQNLRTLQGHDRYRIIQPVSKRLACGDVGVGGLAETADIVSAVQACARPA